MWSEPAGTKYFFNSNYIGKTSVECGIAITSVYSQNVLLINKIDSLVLVIKIRLVGSNNSPLKKKLHFHGADILYSLSKQYRADRLN